MPKRQSVKQLTMENYEDEDEEEPESQGKGIPLAKGEVLNERRIIRARRSHGSKPEAPATQPAGLFSGFSFAKPSAASTPALVKASERLPPASGVGAVNGADVATVPKPTSVVALQTTSNPVRMSMGTGSDAKKFVEELKSMNRVLLETTQNAFSRSSSCDLRGICSKYVELFEQLSSRYHVTPPAVSLPSLRPAPSRQTVAAAITATADDSSPRDRVKRGFGFLGSVEDVMARSHDISRGNVEGVKLRKVEGEVAGRSLPAPPLPARGDVRHQFISGQGPSVTSDAGHMVTSTLITTTTTTSATTKSLTPASQSGPMFKFSASSAGIANATSSVSQSSPFKFGGSSSSVPSTIAPTMTMTSTPPTFKFGTDSNIHSSTTTAATVFSPSQPSFRFGSSSVSSTTAPSTSEPTFKFGLGSSRNVTTPVTSQSMFKFGGATTATSSSSSSSTSSQPLFKFGTAVAGVSVAGPTSSGPPPVAPSLQFNAGASSSSTVVKDGAGGGEEEEYQPPKVEVKQVVEEDSLYSTRCKLFYQKDGQYKDKGVGMLYLKNHKDQGNKLQLLIRADTNLGNILLNISLVKDMSVSQVGKNNILIVCAPNPPIPDIKEPTVPMLIKVKSDASDLLKAIQETLNKGGSGDAADDANCNGSDNSEDDDDGDNDDDDDIVVLD